MSNPAGDKNRIVLERIFSTLAAQQKTSADLARAVGVTDAAVSHWRSGRSGIASPAIHGAALYLGVSVEWLKGNEGDDPPCAAQKIEMDAIAVQIRDGLSLAAERGLRGFTPDTVVLVVAAALERLGSVGAQKLSGG